MKKVVLGLSGGVDSAVSARLLQRQGYEVMGLYLDIGSPEARSDAEKTAEHLGIALSVADVSRDLEEKVCAAFASAYLRGETPNPCIICNPRVKFKYLCDEADRLGVEHIATGHYAVARDGGIYRSRCSNDQSYLLCRVLKSQAERLLLPLGGMEKTETRALAAEMEIPVAAKPDSMEICFIPDKDYIGWLSRRGSVPPPGDMVLDGAVIARHEGIHRWTVGQRFPGIYGGRKVYVSEICPAENRIILSRWEELFKTEVRAADFNWLIDPPAEPIRGSVKVRHTKWECPPCTAYPLPDGSVHIVTDEPVRAPARGQAAVLYDGDRLLGGGTIV